VNVFFRILWLSIGLFWCGLSAVWAENGETPASSRESDPIRIGVIGPFSGPSSFVGPQELRGVTMAVEEFNSLGGVDGRMVTVFHEDDRGWPEKSEAGVAKLIRNGVAAIIGPNNSSCTLVDMQVAAYYKVPLLTSDATATRITSQGNRWVFRCIESDYFRLAALVEYLVEECKIRQIGVFYEDDEYGKGLHADFNKNLARYDLTISFSFPFNRGHKDFTAALEEAEKHHVQALGLFGITTDNLRILSKAHRQGTGFQLFAPGVNERYLSSAARGVMELISTDSYYVHLNKKSVQEFMGKYKSRFNVDPGPIAARSYDTARILLQAMKRARSLSGEHLRDAIFATENFPGLTGNFNFKSNGDVMKKVGVIVVHDGRFIPAREWSERKSSRLRLLIVAVSGFALLLVGSWGWVFTRRIIRRRRRLRALQHYTPIKVNPYIVGNPVREREMFFGREDDFEFIRKNVERRSGGVCLVVCGERRSGKTSVLYQILNGRLGTEYIPVLLDLQLYGNIQNIEEFFSFMIRDIIDSLRKRDMLPPDLDIPAGSKGFERLLDGLIAFYPNKKILLLLDEYEIMESLIQNGILHPSAVGLMAGLLEKYPALSYVLTGSTRLEDRNRAFWEQLISKSLYRKISFLTQKDTQRLIKEPLDELVFHEEGIPERIFRLSAGQPFYTQAICMNMVDHLNEVRKNLVTADDLDSVTEQMIENPLPQILYFWDNFNATEKMVLSLLADALSEQNVPALGAGELLQYARSLQLPVQMDHELMSITLESINTREVLIKHGSEFQFRMDLLRVWVHRDHSPWQMVSEGNNG